MILAKYLNEGDTIGLIAPSGPLKKGSVEDIKLQIEEYGYKVKIGISCHLSYRGYLAGEDEVRARDLENMFLDNRVNAIMCLRGGYGATRILNLIDYEIIKNNPKIFIGFSDITALHIVFNQKCNLATYHGIMGATVKKWDKFTYKSLINAINYTDELLIKNPESEKLYTLHEGYARGKAIGGNLSLIVSSLGTEYEIDTKNKILFIEEVGEYIYRIDRMLTHLELAGKFKDCNGIIFGDFKDCRKSSKDDISILELLQETSLRANKPSIYNLKSGHCMPMITIPLGIDCKLDASKKRIKFL